MATSWDDFPAVGVAPAAAPAYPGVIPGRPRQAPQPTPPSDFTVQTDQRDYGFREGEAGFDNATKLRTEFQALPQVREYQTVIRQYDSALRTDASPTGDQALITAYAKMLDPTSVVREQEFTTVAAGDSALGQATAKLAKELGLDDSGLLRPEVRERVRQNMQNLVRSYNQSYSQARQEYREFAERAGVDAGLVVGEHYGEPFKDTIRDYWTANPQEEGSARTPEMRGGLPVGTEIQFNIDAPDAPFDRGEYLQQRYGITPNQEAIITGFWNANSGNTALTPDMARQWYETQGFAVPADEDLTQAIDDAKAGKNFASLDTSQAEAEYTRQLDEALAQRGSAPESASGAVGVNAAQGIMMEGLDELHGIGGALGAAVRGQNPVAGYQAERDLIRREVQRARHERPVLSGVSTVAGSLLTGGAGFRNVNTVRQAIKPGALTGALVGYNAGEGPANSALGAGVGAIGGAALAAGTQAVAPHVAGALSRVLPERVPAPTVEQAGIIAAGERRNVPIRQPDVRPETRGQRSVARTSERGGPIIRAAEAEDVTALEQAVARDLGGSGEAPDLYRTGDIAQAGLGRVRTAARAKAGRLYTRAHSRSAGVTVDPTKGVAALDEQIADLTRTGARQNKATIDYLREVRADLTEAGGLSIDALRAQRTGLAGNIKQRNLDRTDAERRMGIVHDALAEDIVAGLRNNRDALNDFRQADQLWSEQAKFSRQIARRLLGPDAENPQPAEATARRIQDFVRSDHTRARRLWAELNENERTEIGGMVADSLGRNQNGEFSAALLAKHLGAGRGSLIDRRTARLIFGEDGMRAIDDLRVIARAKQAAASETNTSRTGNIVQSTGRGVRTLLLTWMGFTAGDVTGAVVAPTASNFITSVGEKRAARLLMNPDFTGWLRRLPEATDPAAINRQFARLDSIAARSPGMVADVDALKQALLAGANDNTMAVTGAAADEREQAQR